MAQMTLRTDDDLLHRVQVAARRVGMSMNEYVTAVLDAATNPELAGDAALRTRERLDRAGLLSTPPPLPGRRPGAADIEAAGKRAAMGRSLVEYVGDGR